MHFRTAEFIITIISLPQTKALEYQIEKDLRCQRLRTYVMGVNSHTSVGACAPTMLKWAPGMVVWAPTNISRAPTAVLTYEAP